MMFVPITILVLSGVAFYAVGKSKKGVMDEKRTEVYQAALKTLKDPDKLRHLADAFEKEGLKPQAELLRKRASLRELPADLKDARHEAYLKGMSSLDPSAVNKLAEAFDKEGATGAAASLRTYASGLAKKVA